MGTVKEGKVDSNLALPALTTFQAHQKTTFNVPLFKLLEKNLSSAYCLKGLDLIKCEIFK